MRQSALLSALQSLAARNALALLLGLTGVCINVIPALDTFEQRYGLAWLFQWRGAVAPPTEVVIVALDQASTQALGLSPKPNQWPRDLHARLIHQLAQAGASVIVFDLLFDTPSKFAQQDEALATAMRASGNVVLTESLVAEQEVMTDAGSRPIAQIAIDKTTLPIALLAQAAAGTAPFPLPKNTRVDAAWLFKSDAGATPTLPTLALQLLAHDSDEPLRNLLHQQDEAFAATHPADPTATQQPGSAEKLARQLRHYFTQHPDQGEALLQRADADISIRPQQRRLLRALLHLYRGPDARYLNFYGPPHSITTIPYYLALQANTFAGVLRNKVVFVGYSATETSGQDRIRDDYDSVFSREDGLHLSGVEIIATAFANALDNTFIEPLDALSRLCLIFCWGTMLSLLCSACRASRIAVILLIAPGLYSIIALHIFIHRHLWLPLFTPLLVQLPLTLIATTFTRTMTAKRERLYLQNVFSHFIPPSMVEKLASHAPALGTVDSFLYGVCLATDASNYTSMAETTEPVALTNKMNHYYATLFAPVAQHGGIVSDIKGDAMLAIWRDDDSAGTIRAHACRAALEIHAAITDVSPGAFGAGTGAGTDSDADTVPMLPTRIGLDFGPLTIGNVGAGQHYEYRAVGDTVNTASRIEGLNKQLGTWVLASAAVVDGLDGFLLRALGSFLLRGKSIPVDIVEILGESGDATECDQKKQLCRHFAHALALFQQRQWALAEDAFSAVLRSVPNDGPSQFYVRESVRKRTASTPGSDDSIVRIDDK